MIQLQEVLTHNHDLIMRATSLNRRTGSSRFNIIPLSEHYSKVLKENGIVRLSDISDPSILLLPPLNPHEVAAVEALYPSRILFGGIQVDVDYDHSPPRLKMPASMVEDTIHDWEDVKTPEGKYYTLAIMNAAGWADFTLSTEDPIVEYGNYLWQKYKYEVPDGTSMQREMHLAGHDPYTCKPYTYWVRLDLNNRTQCFRFEEEAELAEYADNLKLKEEDFRKEIASRNWKLQVPYRWSSNAVWFEFENQYKALKERPESQVKSILYGDTNADSPWINKGVDIINGAELVNGTKPYFQVVVPQGFTKTEGVTLINSSEGTIDKPNWKLYWVADGSYRSLSSSGLAVVDAEGTFQGPSQDEKALRKIFNIDKPAPSFSGFGSLGDALKKHYK